MAPTPSLLHRAATASARARRTTLADLQRLLGPAALDDGGLLGAHVADADDAGVAARLAAVIDANPDAEAHVADLLHAGQPASGFAVLKALLELRGGLHALSLVKTRPVYVAAAFDLRDVGDETLRFHLKAGAQGVGAGMVAVMVDLRRPLHVWRISEIESIADGVVTLLKMAEHKVHAATRQLEPACLVAIFDEPIAGVLSGLPTSETNLSLLTDASFAQGEGKRDSAWRRHIAPPTAKAEVHYGETTRLSSKDQLPAVVALHQVVAAPRASAYRFGAKLRAVTGVPHLALRLVALSPRGEKVIDQYSALVESSSDWISIDRTVFTESAHPLRIEVGVLNLDASCAVEVSAPFLETLAPVRRSHRSQGL